MKNSVFIVGATGFVGSSLTRTLIQKEFIVHVLARSKSLNWRLQDIASQLVIHEGDVTDSSLEKIVDSIKPEYIFNCASYGTSPHEQEITKLVDVNIKGTLNLINAIKKNQFKLFVNTGSSSEYGTKQEKMEESQNLEPHNAYGITKAAVSLLCQQVAKKNSLPIVTLRLFSPFGNYEEKKRLIPTVVINSLKNTPIPLTSPGYVRDFIYIEDVVDAYLACMKKELPGGEVINIGSGQQHTVKEVVDVVLKITNSTSQPQWMVLPTQERQQEPSLWEADITKARELLSWKPKNTLESGIEKTVQWFNRNMQLYE